MEKRLYCGAAAVDITPTEAELPGLFGLMGTAYAGIIDRLSARVIALRSGEEKALIVSFDLDKAPEPAVWLPELAAHTGVPEQSILYFGTHTHSAPLTTVRPRERHQATPEQRSHMERYEAVLHEKLFRCADEALAALRPARMGCAYGQSFVNVNRNANFTYTAPDGGVFPFVSEAMNWGAPVDRTLLAIRFEDLAGEPIAFFVNYPVHCCLMFLNNFDGKGSMGVSGDIAGSVSRLLEQKFPGAVAVWSSGAAGDVDPVLFNVFIYPDPADGHCVKEPITSWQVSAQQLRMIVGWHFKDVCDTLNKIQCAQTDVPLASALEWSETPSGGDAPYRIRLQALRVGEAALLGVGGELYNSFGRRLREISCAAYTAVINHNASLIDDAGYILDDDALARTAQDAPVPHMVPGGRARSLPGQVGPSLERHTGSLMEKIFSDR